MCINYRQSYNNRLWYMQVIQVAECYLCRDRYFADEVETLGARLAHPSIVMDGRHGCTVISHAIPGFLESPLNVTGTLTWLRLPMGVVLQPIQIHPYVGGTC